MQAEKKKTKEKTTKSQAKWRKVEVSSSVHTYLVFSSAATAIASPVQRTTVAGVSHVIFKSHLLLTKSISIALIHI